MWWLLAACVADEPADSGDSGTVGHDSADSGADTADTGDSADSGCDARAWYSDTDRDGYGDVATEVLACEAPAGTVADATDCDDGVAAVHPAAPELCNDRDDDCDGEVDDAATDAGTFYADLDGDAHGDPAAPLAACHADVGVVRDGDDCDDADARVYPGAAEVCDDGVDNDCDGDDDGCGVFGDLSAGDADVRSEGSEANGEFGHVLVTIADVTGDGLRDLVAGAPGPGGSWVGPGRVWTFTSLVTGSNRNYAEELEGTAGDDEFGSGLADAGDLDGDGRGDLWVGAPASSDHGVGAGGAWLFLDPSTGGDATGAAAEVWSAGAEYGGNALSSGDLDGDGVVDLVYGNGWGGDGRAGEVWVVPGAGVTSGVLDDVGYAWTGEAADDQAHWSTVGDVDGDGQDDLVAGALNHGGTAGRAYVVAGPVAGAGSLADADVVFDGEAAADYAGRTVFALGDLDGDGVGDLGVGAPSRPLYTRSGRLYVWSQPAAGTHGLGSAPLIVEGSAYGMYVGTTAATGDVDGDGRLDLVTSGPYYAPSSGEGGFVLVYAAPGPGVWADTAADGVIWGEPGGQLGLGLVVEDLDGNGVADVAMGSPEQDSGGAVYVMWGGGV